MATLLLYSKYKAFRLHIGVKNLPYYLTKPLETLNLTTTSTLQVS